MRIPWFLKAAAFKALSAAPGGDLLYRRIQKHATRSGAPTRTRLLGKLQLGKDYAEILTRIGGPDWASATTHIDVGAGWIPTIPLFFYSLGIERQILCDIKCNMDIDGVSETVRLFRELVSECPPAGLRRLPAPVEPGENLTGYFVRLGIRYAAPYGEKDLKPAGKRLVTFTESLPFVEKKALVHLLHTVASAFSVEDVLLAKISFYDQYADFDPSISQFNKWKYPDFVWENFVNSRLMYFNRLTPTDYCRAFAAAGLEVVEFRRSAPTKADREQLRRIRVDRSFRDAPEEELATREVLAVARAARRGKSV